MTPLLTVVALGGGCHRVPVAQEYQYRCWGAVAGRGQHGSGRVSAVFPVVVNPAGSRDTLARTDVVRRRDFRKYQRSIAVADSLGGGSHEQVGEPEPKTTWWPLVLVGVRGRVERAGERDGSGLRGLGARSGGDPAGSGARRPRRPRRQDLRTGRGRKRLGGVHGQGGPGHDDSGSCRGRRRGRGCQWRHGNPYWWWARRYRGHVLRVRCGTRQLLGKNRTKSKG